MAKRKAKRKKQLVRLTIISFTVLALIAFLLPVFWLFLLSVKTRLAIFSPLPIMMVSPVTFANYKKSFQTLVPYILNSSVVAICTTLIVLLFGSLAAYSLARYQVQGKKSIMFWILSIRMTPPIACVIPIFLMTRAMGLLGTKTALIVVYAATNLPLAIWLMQSFFLELPVEIEEAAIVDGCSRLGVLFRIVLPLSASGLIAAAMLTFIFSWNEFLFALILTNPSTRTLPVVASTFITDSGIEWGAITSTGITATLPVLVIAVFIQRYLARGLTFGAVKG